MIIPTMAKSRVLIIQNDATENLGLYEELIKKRTEIEVFRAYSMEFRDSFPETEGYSAFIIGPTPISANNVNHHLFLTREWEFLSRVVGSGKPTLGVCCGGQILARLLGSEVVKSPQREVGGYTVHLTEEGLADPLFHGFPVKIPVFHWHSEMFKVPPGGRLLARGDLCPVQAYAWRNVRGIIFHLEIDHREAERWTTAYPAELEAVRKTREQVLEECRVRAPEMKRLARRLVDNFLAMG